MKQIQDLVRRLAPLTLAGVLALGACDSKTETPAATKDAATGDTAADATTTGDGGATDASSDTGGASDALSDTIADTIADTSADTASDAQPVDSQPDGAGTDAGSGPDVSTNDAIAGSPPCDAYCSSIMAACSGDNAQYVSQEACVTYCTKQAKFQAGTPKDASGNTVGCRQFHTSLAAKSVADAKTHCVHAGPTGGDTCGTWCDNYCELATNNCTVENKLYSSKEACPAECAKAAKTGKAGATSGDSVQCRIYHLGLAGVDPMSATMHCPHAKVPSDPGSPCSDAVAPADPTCEGYCDAVMKSCTGDLAQYGTKDACLTYCKTQGKLAIGKAGETSGNTVGCRTYHAGLAGKDAASALTHCVHSGPTGGDVCGSWCDNYCALAKSNCTGDKVLYSTDADCAAKCGAIKNNGNAGATSGDTVQCRIYHLGVAGTDAAMATTHCPHAKTPAEAGTPCTDPKVAKTWTITTVGFAFDQPDLVISVGDSVKFAPTGIHTATQVDKATWDANGNTPMVGGKFNATPAAPATVKFDTAGDIYYVCIPHASGGMKGKITVK